MRPCSDDGDKFVQLLLCVTHIPRRPLRPSATRTLRSWRDIPDWKKVVCPKIRAFPKSQEFPPPLSETSGIWVDILDSKDSGVAIRIYKYSTRPNGGRSCVSAVVSQLSKHLHKQPPISLQIMQLRIKPPYIWIHG